MKRFRRTLLFLIRYCVDCFAAGVALQKRTGGGGLMYTMKAVLQVKVDGKAPAGCHMMQRSCSDAAQVSAATLIDCCRYHT